jgi:serine/threonine-protein kinase
MICRLGGEFDFVKVVDFGLVKNTDQNAITHTKTASLAGTPLYMAPERWSNTVENDPRSDIYAIGAVAYRLLSGREIYSADSTVGLIEKILSANVTPLSDLGCTDIPPVLEELVMSCLASNMDARPSSVSVILNKLESLKGASLWKQSDARQWWANWELASRGKEIRADSKTPENSA